MKPRLVFTTPQPVSLAHADGLHATEITFKFPMDAPPGVALTYCLTLEGVATGEVQHRALAAEELGDFQGLADAIAAWMHAIFVSKGIAPVNSTATTVEVAAPVQAPIQAPGIRLR